MRPMADTPEEIERRLDAGEWLTIGDVSVLLKVDRSTAHRMLKTQPPMIRYRFRAGPGRYRELHPEDVRRELDQRREVHGE